MSLTDVVVSLPGSETTVLRFAAAVEAASEHPVGEAVVEDAKRRGVEIPAVDDFASIAGHGVTGRIEGVTVHVGSRRLMRENALVLPKRLAAAAERLEGEGKTAIFAAWNGEIRAVLAVADTLKESAPAAIEKLRALGVEVVMLTGDNARTAESIVSQVGIERVLAEVLPADKVREVHPMAFSSVSVVSNGLRLYSFRRQ